MHELYSQSGTQATEKKEFRVLLAGVELLGELGILFLSDRLVSLTETEYSIFLISLCKGKSSCLLKSLKLKIKIKCSSQITRRRQQF